MSSCTLRIACRLAAFAALMLPLAASAEGKNDSNGAQIGTLAVPTLGPLGFVGLAASAAGAGILIYRNRRKDDED